MIVQDITPVYSLDFWHGRETILNQVVVGGICKMLLKKKVCDSREEWKSQGLGQI